MRKSQPVSAERVVAFSFAAQRHALLPIAWVLLAIASIWFLICPTVVVAQDQPAPSTQSDEDLKDRVKSLERTVEEMKKDRDSPKLGEAKTEEVPKVLSPGTFWEVPEHERLRGMLRQDNYAAPRFNNAPFDPSSEGFLVSQAQTACCVSGALQEQT